MKTNNFEDTDSIEMGKPTLEDYQKAQGNYKMYCSWVTKARERKNELIDSLSIERANELMYLEQAEKQRDIIRRYEIYEQLEKGKKNER